MKVFKKAVLGSVVFGAFATGQAQAGVLGSIGQFFQDLVANPISTIIPDALESPETLVTCRFVTAYPAETSEIRVERSRSGDLFVYLKTEDKHVYVEAEGSLDKGFGFLNLENYELKGTLQLTGASGNVALRTKTNGMGRFNDAITACVYE